MPRKKISEFSAKSILYDNLEQEYQGVAVTAANPQAALKRLHDDESYVVKVDQGVKGRFKKGLVKLNRTKAQVAHDVAAFAHLGYEYLLVEPVVEHEAEAERYLAFERQRSGVVMSWSAAGGVNVEAAAGEMRRAIYSPDMAAQAAAGLGVPVEVVTVLARSFDANYFSFLEINPLVVTGGRVTLLDAAVEVDSEAAFFVSERWTPADFRQHDTATVVPEMAAVEKLAAQSQASFRLAVLNPNGSIFLLLSGGGASVVLADEVFNLGYGQELGNYGEYSGNPNTEETTVYTRQIISLMLGSHAPRKVLVIAGGVANFTDVRATFKGVIAAINEAKTDLKKQGIKVYVRRGGPFEVEGLALMRGFLEREGLLGEVAGPEMLLPEIVARAAQELEVQA